MDNLNQLREAIQNSTDEEFIKLGKAFFHLQQLYADACKIAEEKSGLAEIGQEIVDLPEGFCFMHTPKEFLIRNITSQLSPSFRGPSPLLAFEKFKMSRKRSVNARIEEDTDD